MSVSQPGMGAVCMSGMRFAAASVLDKPPGLVKSTSQASISRGTRSVNPIGWILASAEKSLCRRSRSLVLLPQTANTSTPLPSESTMSRISSPVFPNPMLPDIIRYQCASLLMEPLSENIPEHSSLASALSTRIQHSFLTGIPNGYSSSLRAPVATHSSIR